MKKNPAFETLAVRSASGLVIAAVVVAAILVSPYTFLALLLVICAGAMKEFYSIAGKAGTEPQKWVGTIIGLAVILIVSAGWLTTEHRSLGLALMIAMFFVVFIRELYRHKEQPLLNAAVTLAGILYIALPLALLSFIVMIGGDYMPYVTLGYFVLVWSNDVGAYLVGVKFGKHKLFERISPKKSWEGFFGGLMFAVGVGWLIGSFVPMAGLVENPRMFWIGLSALVVVTGVLGDLVESLLKRSVMIKDSGSVIPGHGGFLDRFDALIFSVPFVYLYFVIFAL